MTLGEMISRVSARLNESATGPTFYPASEIQSSISEGLRFFTLLTLCLESTAAWSVPAATPFSHMLTTAGFQDWIAPLRIADSTGAKIRPARLADLTALDSAWLVSPGAPIRYTFSGADLIGIYKQPASTGTMLSVTYCRGPRTLVNLADVPEIPGEFHPELVKYGVYRMRQREGSQEFEKVLPLFGEYLDAAQRYGDYIRARNKAALYETAPPELALYDRSDLLRIERQARAA
jgi:hypothetical protein